MSASVPPSLGANDALWGVLRRIEDSAALVDNAADAIDWVVHERLALVGDLNDYARAHIYSVLVLAARALREAYAQIEKEVGSGVDLASRRSP